MAGPPPQLPEGDAAVLTASRHIGARRKRRSEALHSPEPFAQPHKANLRSSDQAPTPPLV